RRRSGGCRIRRVGWLLSSRAAAKEIALNHIASSSFFRDNPSGAPVKCMADATICGEPFPAIDFDFTADVKSTSEVIRLLVNSIRHAHAFLVGTNKGLLRQADGTTFGRRHCVGVSTGVWRPETFAWHARSCNGRRAGSIWFSVLARR